MTRWERFCVVGIGNHARTKLIPAIAANGQTLAAVVSRQPRAELPDVPVFPTLTEALAALPRDTAIVIATPPALHYAYATAALAAGFDTIVEKPAFVTVAEAREVAQYYEAGQAVFVEGFMQRHSGLYERLLAFCAAVRVAALDLEFLIPALPPGTFRDAGDPAASGLYDIGCYVLALVSDLGLEPAGLRIAGVEQAGTAAEAITLAGTLDGVAVTARIGVGNAYANRATVRRADGTETAFAPVFYGRPGPKTIGDETIEDGNAFAAIFAVPRERWLADQPDRLAAVIDVTAALETLAGELSRFRAAAR